MPEYHPDAILLDVHLPGQSGIEVLEKLKQSGDACTVIMMTADPQLEDVKAALRLEHATIPPYLTALYSLRAGSNSPAWHILRVVAVEEMLHLTLVANVMNAVGCKPNLTDPEFVPEAMLSVSGPPFTTRSLPVT